MKNILITIAMLLLISTLATSAVKMEFSSYDKDNKSNAEENYIILTNDMLKLDNTNTDEGKLSVIFDANKEKFVILKHNEKKYIVISKEMLNHLKKQMETMRENMERQLANLPDAQKKQAEKMMEGRMGKKDINYSVEKTSENKKINNWNATKYNLKEDDNITDEVWVTPIENSGFTKSDFAVIQKFSDFSNEFSKINPKAKRNTFSLVYEKVQGIPIMTINETTNKVSELKKIERYEASDSEFNIPNDYTEEKLPIPGMNR